MPTKTELEAKIAALETIIRNQVKALDQVRDAGLIVEIPLPGWEHNQSLTHAHTFSGERCKWEKGVMKLFFSLVRQHGVKAGWPEGTFAQNHISLTEGSGTSETFLIPVLAGKFLIELINVAGDYGNACYSSGVREGSNLLKMLAQNQIKPEEFEDRLNREKSKELQNQHRRLKVKKYKD